MKITKFLAFALAVIMAFSMVSVSAFAAYAPVSRSALLDKVDDSAYNVIVDWDFNNLTNTTANYTSSNIPSGGYIATHTGGTGYKVTQSKFQFMNNANGRIKAKDGALYIDNSVTNTNTYIDICASSAYVNPKKDAASATNVNAVFNDYAGKSFVISMDVKLDFVPANTGVAKIMQFLGIQSVFTTGDATPQPFAFDIDTGRFYYADGSHSEINQRAASDVYLSNTRYTNITCAIDIPNNSYDLYADGVLVKADIQYLPDNIKASILGPSASLTTATPGASNNITVANDPLSTAEQKANPMLLYVPSCVRMFQVASASIYVDNFRFYFDDVNHDVYNSANTVEGYDLTINNGVLGLNYYLNLTGDVLADEGAKVRFTTARGEVQETFVKDVTAETNGSYKFTAKVSSVEMASAIKMEIVSGESVYNIYKNGTASEAYEYSVKEYADQVIAGEYAEAMKNVAKAMLNYGAAAQVYFGFNTEKLASENYTEALAQVTSNDISAVAITGTAPAGTKAALILDSNTSIVIYNAQGEKIGEKTGINSKNLDTSYEITCEGGTVTVSVLAIGEKVLASGTTSENYKNLVKALKLFSDASKAV